MNVIFYVLKRTVMALCMLYAINLIVISVGVTIPINIVSIISVALLGIPAVFGLIIIDKFI